MKSNPSTLVLTPIRVIDKGRWRNHRFRFKNVPLLSGSIQSTRLYGKHKHGDNKIPEIDVSLGQIINVPLINSNTQRKLIKIRYWINFYFYRKEELEKYIAQELRRPTTDNWSNVYLFFSSTELNLQLVVSPGRDFRIKCRTFYGVYRSSKGLVTILIGW